MKSKIKTNRDDVFKIRIGNSNPEFEKHEVIKILIVIKLLHKYKKLRNNIRIYTEFKLENGLKPDIYFENLKSKEVIVYEIQKDTSGGYVEKKALKYNELDIPFFNSLDFITIHLKEFSDDINEISEKLDEYLV